MRCICRESRKRSVHIKTIKMPTTNIGSPYLVLT